VVRIIASRQAVLTVRLASGDLVVTVRNIRRHGRFVKARFPLMAGNWKMHGDHLQAVAQVQKLASALSAKDFDCSEVAVLPPFTSLRGVQTLVDGDKLRIAYGAQDLSPHDSGAYTGEVSGPMLAELGCRYVLAGHSERRQYHAESAALVNGKVMAALRSGLTPILCVGEPLEVRQSGQHVAYTLGQLDGSLDGVPAPAVASLVIAYEPVWAIGTGEVATAEDAQEAASAIRSQISVVHGPETAGSVRILYGGSVKVSNIAPIMAQPDVDGALVGGASLDAGQFAQICRYRELSVS
jgi:triosephosphate isomerase